MLFESIGHTLRSSRLRPLLARVGWLVCVVWALTAVPGMARAAGILVVSQQGLDFGLISVGSTSPNQTVTVRNAGDATLTFTSLGSSGAPFFNAPTTCTPTLASGMDCQISFNFAPSASGMFNGTATVVSDVGSQSIQLTGSASGPAFPLVVSGTSFNFGAVSVGTTSANQRVLVSNPTASPVVATVAGGGISAPFGAGTTCGGATVTLAPGASCYIQYDFAPTALGPATGSTTIQVTVGAVVRNFTVTGAGEGTFPLVVSPVTLNFGEVAVGTTSANQGVLVSNPTASHVVATVAGGGISAPFGAGTTCGGATITLAPGASCYIQYDFAPTALGPATGSTTIQLNIGGVVRNFPIATSGTGINVGGGTFPLVVSGTSFNFGAVSVGTTSANQRVLVSNPTASPVVATVAGGGISAPFGAGTTCGGATVTLAPGASCYIQYDFAPTALGPATGSTTIQVTVGAVVRNFTVTGAGEGTFPLVVSPVTLNFGEVAVGTTSANQGVLVSNPTASHVVATVAGGGISAPFGAGTTCGGATITLAPGASCYIQYDFAPTALGPATGNTTIQLNIGGVVRNFPIATSGTGTGAGPRLQLTPFRLDFGPIPLSTTSPGLAVTVTNGGTGPLTGLAVTVPAAPFALASGACPATLAAGASCTLTYTYAAPAVAGPNTATLAVSSSAGDATIQLNARAVLAAPAGGTVAVPTLGSLSLAGLSALLAGLGWLRRRRLLAPS